MSGLPDYVRLNRDQWTRNNAEYTDAAAENAWAQPEIIWGVWSRPESQLRILPELSGTDAVELGCGTAYFSAWLKRAGARRVVGVDVTPAQLATARRLDARYGLGLELLEANAESVPLPDASFDLVLSEYGASLYCDPKLWIPEAARLLRPGGQLVFTRNSTLAILCMSDAGRAGDRLEKRFDEIGRLEWYDVDPGVEFHPPHGELLRILRGAGFELLDLLELCAPAGAQEHPRYNYVPVEWAQRWPAEEIWKARKRTSP